MEATRGDATRTVHYPSGGRRGRGRGKSVRAMFQSTLCSSPRFVRVHALFESTLCSSPRFLTRQPVVQTAHSHCFKKPRLFSVHACSPSTLFLRPRLFRVAQTSGRVYLKQNLTWKLLVTSKSASLLQNQPKITKKPKFA